MSRRDPLREALERLSEVRKDPSSPASIAERQRVLALAALRRDEAFDYLLTVVRDGEPAEARAAVAALAMYRDESLLARAREAAAARPGVAAEVERAFASGRR